MTIEEYITKYEYYKSWFTLNTPDSQEFLMLQNLVSLDLNRLYQTLELTVVGISTLNRTIAGINLFIKKF